MTRRASKYGLGGERVERSLVVKGFTTRDEDTQGTLEWRRFLIGADGSPLSYWHDVPLVHSPTTLHAFIEIPKNTRAKYEVCPTESSNPMKQDVKKGKPRLYNLDIKWNYGYACRRARVARGRACSQRPTLRGLMSAASRTRRPVVRSAFPQTWEQPEHAWEGLEGYAGDDDPVDVVDLSSNPVEARAAGTFEPWAGGGALTLGRSRRDQRGPRGGHVTGRRAASLS